MAGKIISVVMTAKLEQPFREGAVVSGLLFSKVSACSLIINDSAEARLGGRMKQSLLKQNLEP